MVIHKILLKKLLEGNVRIMEVGKVPPHDLDAEQAVIGSMLTDADAVVSSIEILKPEDFYRADNRIIYEAMFKSL